MRLKRCQRYYGMGATRRMCGRPLARTNTTDYCPSCEAKLDSVRRSNNALQTKV